MIQSSACIYSKKVEFLYNLIYQTLEFLANKQKLNNNKKKNELITQDEENIEEEEGEEVVFLQMNDLKGIFFPLKFFFLY